MTETLFGSIFGTGNIDYYFPAGNPPNVIPNIVGIGSLNPHPVP